MRLYLRHNGNGVFEAATSWDARMADEKYAVGSGHWHDIKERRSSRQNRYWRGMIRTAYHNAPEGDDRFESAEHLAAAVLCQMGHSDDVDIEVNEDSQRIEDAVCAVVEAVRGRDRYAFVRTTAEGMRVSIPQSVSFSKCKPDVFRDIVDQTKDALLRIYPGLDVDALESEAA